MGAGRPLGSKRAQGCPLVVERRPSKNAKQKQYGIACQILLSKVRVITKLFISRFNQTLLYFYMGKGSKSGKDLSPKEFFNYWISFCSDFKDIWKREQTKLMKEM
jgi:hypothetical protein